MCCKWVYSGHRTVIERKFRWQSVLYTEFKRMGVTLTGWRCVGCKLLDWLSAVQARVSAGELGVARVLTAAGLRPKRECPTVKWARSQASGAVQNF